jgi:hypothetical protein
MKLRSTDSARYGARLLTDALRPPDPQRSPSNIRVYWPDGTLRAELTPDQWRQRFPHRLAPTRPGRPRG